ncbi:DedA family protein [Plasmodiophora brassicae]|uniref:DedA family protein n=1 Tax=Plasmodiophora brassicae TaxID=37360 RepID=A0A0G4J8S4_PLABS|nr:hypothetical protein PBRA_009570 [Plasmodiophora brassicae]
MASAAAATTPDPAVGAFMAEWGVAGAMFVTALDSAGIPTMGGPDAAVLVLGYRTTVPIVLLAALCAAASTIGSIALYHAGSSRGQWALSKMGVSTANYQRMRNWLHSGAALFVFIAAFGPPPTPKKAMVIVAGCAHVHMSVFVPNLFVGRLFRFLLIGWIGREYGAEALHLFDEYKLVFITFFISLIGLAALTFVFFRLPSRSRPQSDASPDEIGELVQLAEVI